MPNPSHTAMRIGELTRQRSCAIGLPQSAVASSIPRIAWTTKEPEDRRLKTF
jgi:hypothetical protein